jgi:hypothetical protein
LEKRIFMPPVDRPLVADKLREVQNLVPVLRKAGLGVAEKVEFTNWRHDVMRWLRAGEIFTGHQATRFANIRFKPPEWGDRQDRAKSFEDGLSEADHTLAQAIENLELGIRATEKEPKPEPAAQGPLVVNNNVNVNLNLISLLETVASEIEKQDPAEGKGFRETIKRWSENPKVWDVLLKAGDLFLRGTGR